MKAQVLPLDFYTPAKNKRQHISINEVVEFLKGKTVHLPCGHKFAYNEKGVGHTMIVYAWGDAQCED
jgi:hypothetical protein